MYCLHCKYTTKLRNDKEINAFFASYKGVQLSPLGFAACQSKNCTNKANSANYRRVWHPCHTHATTKLSSHRTHRTHRIFLAQDFLPQIAQMSTD